MVFRRIRELREENDLQQTQVAEYLNVSQNTYALYENGTIDIPSRMIVRLAVLYDTSMDYILDRTDEKDPYPPCRYPVNTE